jgi:Icc-related predicted phosphoesterase
VPVGMMDDPKMVSGNIDKVNRTQFGDFMFPNSRPLHTIEEKIESDVKEEESNVEPSKTTKNQVFIAIGSSKSGKFKSFESVSGQFIITRVWEGCNMTSFRKRMKKRK